MSKKNVEVFIPGKAYDIVAAADFVTCKGKALKTLSDDAKAARVAVKEAEKRAKGRGYRYLTTLSPAAAIYLCQWWDGFLASDDYRKLGTAESLAVRTIAGRICEVASLSKEQKEKQKEVNAKRAAAMAAGRRAKSDAQAIEIAARVKRYREWLKLDSQWHNTPAEEREELGLVKPILEADMICSDDEYKLARERGLI